MRQCTPAPLPSDDARLALGLDFPDETSWGIEESDESAPPDLGVDSIERGDEDDEAVAPLAPLPPPREPVDADDLVLELGLEPDAPPPCGRLCNVALVRLNALSGVCPLDTGARSVDAGQRVVVETEQGLVVADVVRSTRRDLLNSDAPRLVRTVDANDRRQQARNAVREREAFLFCKERIAQRKLPMKLIRVEYLHGGNKALFYFAAEHRVDFRELVKDLAQRYHVRIMMRQVGVRDEARMTGSIGSCGAPLCCTTWLSKFEPVSIRMAKDQNLVLNPQKVSGQCGRLKCCLVYEQAQYQEARRKLPKSGRTVKTPDGEGKVQDMDVLRGLVSVALTDGKVQTYRAEQVEQLPSAGKPAGRE